VRAKELREREDSELHELLMETKNNLFQDRIKNATHQLNKTSDLNTNRKEVARILTVLNERKINSSKTAGQE